MRPPTSILLVHGGGEAAALNAQFQTRRFAYRLAGWTIDVAARELVSPLKRIRLEPLSLKFLLVLIENHGRVTPKQELVEKVWGRRVVTDDAFARQLAKLRAALAEDPSGENAIETLPKTGLRLVAPVSTMARALEPCPRRRLGRLAAASVAGVALLGLAATVVLRPPSRGPMQIRPFSSELGEEIEPALSPDGRWLVYAGRSVGDERFGLYLRALDEEARRRITSVAVGARRPAWSASGRSIAFFARSPGGCAIMVGSPFSARYRPVAACDNSEGGLAWLDDDRLIASDRAGYGAPMSLRLIVLGNGRSRGMTSPAAGTVGDTQPLASPDGSAIYFVRTISPGVGRLAALEITSGRIRELSREAALVRGIARGRHGRLLVAATRPGGASGLWEVDPRDGEWREVAPVDGSRPTASADGAKVVFEQSPVSGAVWMQRASTGQAWRLTNSTRFDRQPALSPDHRRVAFISDRRGPPELWLQDVPQGAARRALRTQALTPVSFGWSPESDRLIIAGRNERGPGLFILSLGSNRLERLRSQGSEAYPCFSEDGRRIHFTRRSGRRFSIIERDLASGAERLVVENALRALPAPGGAALLFVRPFEPGLWRLDRRSRRVARLSESSAPADRLNWAVSGDAVWVTDRQAGRLLLIGLSDRAVRASRPLPALAHSSGLSASGDYLLHAQLSAPETDLYLMERGRGR